VSSLDYFEMTVAQRDLIDELRVIVVMGDKAISHPLKQPEIRIGRFTGSTLVIDHESLSRFHAVLRIGPPMTIEDLGSVNGTFVREVKIKPGQHVPVTVGDVIRVGAVILILRDSTTQL